MSDVQETSETDHTAIRVSSPTRRLRGLFIAKIKYRWMQSAGPGSRTRYGMTPPPCLRPDRLRCYGFLRGARQGQRLVTRAPKRGSAHLTLSFPEDLVGRTAG